MAKKTSPKAAAKPMQISIRNYERSTKTIQKWKNAIIAAENVYNPNRILLYELYKDIAEDTHVESLMAKRRLAVTTQDYQFVVNGEPHEEINRQFIGSVWFRQMLEHMIDRRFYGFSLIWTDLSWLYATDAVLMPECQIVDRRHVRPEKHEVVLNPWDTTGISYLTPEYAPYVLPVGRSADLGLLLKVAPWVILKRGDIGDWATFNQLFGIPIKKATYDPSIQGAKRELEEALEKAAAAAHFVLPDGSDLEVLQASGTGATDTFQSFADFCNKEMSKAIVLNTLTTEVDKRGSLSQGEVHQEAENALKAADMVEVLQILNSQVKRILTAWGFTGIEKGEFTIQDKKTESKKDMLETMLRIHKDVAPLDKKQFVEAFGVEFDEKAEAEKKKEEKQQEKQQEKDAQDKAKGDKNKDEELALGDVEGVRSILGTYLDKLRAAVPFFDAAPR